MNKILQSQIQSNLKMYEYLKQNSYYFKLLDQGRINYATFVRDMKEKYKERITDKIDDAMDKINLVSSVLDVLN
jgi:site-specific recombinase